MAGRCRSDLPLDLLYQFLRCLPLKDYIRFGAVCKPWRSAVKQSRHPPLPQSPWLLLPGGNFFGPFEKRVFRFGGISSRYRRCIGSSYGWLVLLDEKLQIHLFEPLTQAHVQLPSFANTPGVDPARDLFIDKAFLVSQNHPDSSALRDSGYTVLVIYGEDHENLAFVRGGDESWTLLDRELTDFRDVVYHKGLFYTVDVGEEVMGWDLTGAAPHLVKRALWEERLYMLLLVHLVEASGDLLQLLGVGFGKVEVFVVFKLDPNKLEWVEVESLDDVSVLLGFGGSMAFSALDCPALRGNCIYFVDKYQGIEPVVNHDLAVIQDVHRELKVYNLQDGSMETYYSYIAPLIWPPEFGLI